MTKKQLLHLYIPLCLAVFYSVFFTSCNRIFFEKSMPINAKIVKVLPDFFDGNYRIDKERSGIHFGQLYYKIDRISEQHCLVYEYDVIHIDTLKMLYSEDTNISAEVKGNTMVITKGDSVEIIPNIEIKDDKIHSPHELLYELNLSKGTFTSYSDEKATVLKCILKSKDGEYYLNRVENEKWFTVVFSQNEEGTLQLTYGDLDTGEYDKNKTYYDGITPIKKTKDTLYYANPTDTEFFAMMEEEALTNQEHWYPEEDNTFVKYSLWFFVLVGGILLIGTFIYVLRSKMNYKF